MYYSDPMTTDAHLNGHEPAATSYTLIRDLPATDRPRERLRDAGARALSNAELLAILLRTGSSKESALSQATRLLGRFGGIAGMQQAPFAELCNEHGLGEAKAAQIQAAIELGMRVASASPDSRAIVRSPEDVANLMMAEMSLLPQEHVRVVMLNARNQVIGIREIYQGSVHTAQVRIGELFRDAVAATANAIVVVHNHPSGDPTPSSADIVMTKSLEEAGKMLNIDVADHLVIAGGRYVSMRAVRLGFVDGGAVPVPPPVQAR